MNRIKAVATIFCLSLAALVFSPGVNADGWNKKTVVTFSQPVEIPGGVVLPAGTYVFKLRMKIGTLVSSSHALRHYRSFNRERISSVIRALSKVHT